MNLTEALKVALPDLPVRPKRYPKFNPALVAGEQIEEGEAVIKAVLPGSPYLFTFTPGQWRLAQLFDGQHSYQQVAERYTADTGIPYSEEEAQAFAETLDESNFWMTSALEKNIALAAKVKDQRQKAVAKAAKSGDLSLIYVWHWDPDKYLTWLHPRLSFLYSRWFIALTLVMFAFMGYVFLTGWSEIGRDTLKYYTFTEKGVRDLAEFWILFLVLGFVHESAHGLTCKHYRGGVHRMGFVLVYLSPAFYVDVTESYVYASRWQRLAITMAGIWSELMCCTIATVAWWGTSPGSYIHDFSYKVMLITGVAVVLMNLNPLIKLDGYHALSETLGYSDLKENSTVYVSSWVKKRIFRLPVEIEHVPKRRRPFYVVYALLSGLYSYGLLYAVSRFVFNVFHRYSPDWAFVPGLAVAYVIFRSRLRKLVTFMKMVYLDKKERVRAWFTPQRALLAGTMALLLLCLPIWRRTVSGRFLLEPIERLELRAEVDGRVLEVAADTAQPVSPNVVLVRLENLSLESRAAKVESEYRMAASRATDAELNYGDYAAAERDKQQLTERRSILQEQVAKLQLKAPVNGLVLTPRPRDQIGSYVTAGTELLEVADLSRLRARIYIPEFEMQRLHVGLPASLLPEGHLGSIKGRVASLAPASSQVPEGLLHLERYKGLRPPQFYIASVDFSNPSSTYLPGTTGEAKISVGRCSIASFTWEAVRDFFARKVW